MALLVRALPSLEGIAAQEVLTQLATVDKRPSDSEPVRQVILTGLKLGQDGAPLALKLLEKWCGKPEGPENQPWADLLAGWQKWYAEQYPDAPPAVLPKDAEGSRWTEQELLAALNGPEAASGLPRRGAVVFEKAQCIKCHRFGNRGEAIGPDLSTVGLRFQKREILESILFPSHIISDQYASKTITTVDGKTYTGMIAASGERAIIVLQASGQKTTIPRPDRRNVCQQEVGHARRLAQSAYAGRDRRSVRLADGRGKIAPPGWQIEQYRVPWSTLAWPC